MKNGPAPKGRPADLTQLWEASEVNMCQHPCGMLSTPFRVHEPKVGEMTHTLTHRYTFTLFTFTAATLIIIYLDCLITFTPTYMYILPQ
jgi:hypothetical protein